MLSGMLSSALTAPATSGGSPCPVGKAVGITSNTGPASLAQDTCTPSPTSPASGKTFASILQTWPPPHCSFTFNIQRPPPPPSPQSLSASSLSHIPNSLTPIEVPNLHPGLLCSLVKGRKPSQRKWPYGVRITSWGTQGRGPDFISKVLPSSGIKGASYHTK